METYKYLINDLPEIYNMHNQISKEISKAVAFLHFIKVDSLHVIKILKSIEPSVIDIQELIKVNTIYLKYLSVLNEINSKFEAADILENYKFTPKGQKIISESYDSNSMTNSIHNKVFYNLKASENPLKENNEELDSFTKSHHMKIKSLKIVSNTCTPSYDCVQFKENFFSIEKDNDSRVLKSYNIKENAKEIFIDGKCLKYSYEELSPEKIKLLANIPDLYIDYPVQHIKNKIHNIGNIDSSKENIITILSDSSVTEKHFKNFEASLPISELVISTKAIANKTKNTNLVMYKDKHYNSSDKQEKKLNDLRNLSFTEHEKNIMVGGARKQGYEFKVAVVHVQSPSEFYVYFSDIHINLLQELQQKLKEIPGIIKVTDNKNNLPKKILLSRKIGINALYYSICDETWFRAQVKDWCLHFDDKYVFIFIIDTGESKCVSFDYLKPIPDDIMSYPVFIERCHLSGVCPIHMKENSETFEWLKNSNEQMKSWIESSKGFKVEIDVKDEIHHPTSIPVKLWLEEKYEYVNELLIKNNLAKKYMVNRSKTEKNTNKNKEFTAANLELENWNPMKEEFESYKNLYELNINNPAAVIYGYVGKDYQRICRQFVFTGKCFKGKSCKKEHVVLNPSGYTTDREKVYSNAFNSLFPLHSNEIFNIEVTCILTINTFYCIKKNTNLENDEESLSTLIEYMNSPTNIQAMQKLLIPPSTGQVVIAKYSRDDSWYRARVIETEPENNICTVLFVDYGNTESMPFTNIRAIEPRYLHLPFQAIRCLIYGIDKNPEGDFEGGMEYLNTKLENQNLSIRLLSKFPGEEVSLLVNLLDEKGYDIGEELISKKYAIRKKQIIIDKDSKMLPG